MQKFEAAGGRPGLRIDDTFGHFDPDDPGIGRGMGTTTILFSSEESREYYIRLRESEERYQTVNRDLRRLRHDLIETLTASRRIRRNKLLKLIASVEDGMI